MRRKACEEATVSMDGLYTQHIQGQRPVTSAVAGLLPGRLWLREEMGEGVDDKGLVGVANLRANYKRVHLYYPKRVHT